MTEADDIYKRYKYSDDGEKADFEGCTTYPKVKGRSTKNDVTGDAQGICARCGNFTAHLSDLGYCPDCEKVIDKRSARQNKADYIKAGSRSQVDL